MKPQSTHIPQRLFRFGFANSLNLHRYYLRRKSRGEVARLEEDLTITEQQHLTCQLHLANMIRMAEQSITSQNAYQIMAENELKMRNENLQRSLNEKFQMGKMEESLRVSLRVPFYLSL